MGQLSFHLPCYLVNRDPFELINDLQAGESQLIFR